MHFSFSSVHSFDTLLYLKDEFVFTLDELARCIGDGSSAPPASERTSSPTSSGYDGDDMIIVPVTSDLDDDPFPKRRVSILFYQIKFAIEMICVIDDLLY